MLAAISLHGQAMSGVGEAEPSEDVKEDGIEAIVPLFRNLSDEGLAEEETRKNLSRERQVLLTMLLAQVCAQHDATPRTFVEQVLRLYELGVLDSIQFLYDLGMIDQLTDGSDALVSPLDEVRHVRSILESTMPVPLSVDTSTLSVSRYRRDFREECLISAGGFGSVFKAVHGLDGAEYAIKKIAFRGSQLQSARAQMVLREVQNLSQLEHHNCVRYHTAWLESNWIPEAEKSPPDLRERMNALVPVHLQPKLMKGLEDMVMSGQERDELSDWSGSGMQYSTWGNNDMDTFGGDNAVDSVPGSAPLLNYDITLHIQMTLCEGQTLREWLHARNGSMERGKSRCIAEAELPRALELFQGIVNGLAYIHGRNIIHRDLKPENILVTLSGQCKIVDFGLSTIVGHKREAREGIQVGGGEHTSGVGTASYASPEQLKHTSYSCSSDIWSLGLVLAELVCVFMTVHERAEAFSELRANATEWPACCQEVAEKFPSEAGLILTLLQPDPELRPTADEILQSNTSSLVSTLQKELNDKSKLIEEQRQEIASLQKQLQEQAAAKSSNEQGRIQIESNRDTLS
ncbi:unnamed protein product [Chrysoparadoxa australica]